MPATANSLFERHERAHEEILTRGLDVILPKVDPIWQNAMSSSVGVQSNSILGRDYEFVKVYFGSVSGVIDGSIMTNDFSLYGDPATTTLAPKFYTQQASRTFPSAQDSPVSVPYQLKGSIAGLLTNLPFTLAESRAEASPGFIQQVLAPKLTGFARNLAQSLCNYWYVNQSDGYALCRISGISSITGSGPWFFSFTPNNNAIYRFIQGQRVDIYTNSSGVPVDRKNDTQSATANQTVATRLSLFVAAVDPVANRVTLVSATDPAGWAGGGGADPTDGDFVLLANTKLGTAFNDFYGYNSWCKFGGSSPAARQLLGSAAVGTLDAGIIDVDRHPEFKSYLHKNGGAALTENKLLRILRGWHAAKDPIGQEIDTLVASEGVWAAYESQKIGLYDIDRTNRLSSLNSEGSAPGFTFTVNGRTYKGLTSHYIESGTVIGIKMGGNNWKKLVPPSPSGVTEDGNPVPGMPFKFVSRALGGTDRLPVLQTTSYQGSNQILATEMYQKPGMLHMQLVPDQPAMLKITGVAEERLFGETE